jgi:hypothetical protein
VEEVLKAIPEETTEALIISQVLVLTLISRGLKAQWEEWAPEIWDQEECQEDNHRTDLPCKGCLALEIQWECPDRDLLEELPLT